MRRTAELPDGDPFDGGSPEFYASPGSKRKVDLPSLINLLLGAGDWPNPRAPDRRDGSLTASRMRPATAELGAARGRIDWGRDLDALRRGDLGTLPQEVAGLIGDAAQSSAIAAYAKLWGIDADAAALGLLAASESRADGSAGQLARAILVEAAAGEIEMALRDVGLR
jgi:hypothetical protein